jgi:hypothetical protein
VTYGLPIADGGDGSGVATAVVDETGEGERADTGVAGGVARDRVEVSCDVGAQPGDIGLPGEVGLRFPKPVKRVKEPKRLRQVSAKRQSLIDAGEASRGMKRSRLVPKPPRRLDGPGSDPGRLAFARSLPCVGRSHLPGHICRGRNTASHLRDHTGAGLQEDDSLSCCMCWSLHLEEWELHRGQFAGWTRDQRSTWMRERCEETEALWQALTEERRTWWREVGAQSRRSAS